MHASGHTPIWLARSMSRHCSYEYESVEAQFINSSEHSSEHGAWLLAAGSKSKSATTSLRGMVVRDARLWRCRSRDVQRTHEEMRSKPKMTAVAAAVNDTVFLRLKTLRGGKDVRERSAGASPPRGGFIVSESGALSGMMKLGMEVLFPARETVLDGSSGSACAGLRESTNARERSSAASMAALVGTRSAGARSAGECSVPSSLRMSLLPTYGGGGGGNGDGGGEGERGEQPANSISRGAGVVDLGGGDDDGLSCTSDKSRDDEAGRRGS